MIKDLKKQLAIILVGTCSISAIITKAENKTASQNDYGFNTSQMDLKVKPGDDFYKYAVGSWIKNTPIPKDRSSWGVFNELNDKAYYDLHSIITSLAKEKQKSQSIQQQVLDFYLSGMDMDAIDNAGNKPLLPYFKSIEDIKNQKMLAEEIANLQKYIAAPIFNVYVAQDAKDTNTQILSFMQGGLGLPEKSYYLNTDEYSKNIRAKYLDYISKLFTIYGDTQIDAKKYATTVLDIETKLAKISKSPDELRDPIANYNKVTVKELEKISPNFDWKDFFSTLGFKDKSLDIGQVEFFKQLSDVLKQVSLEDWKIYLKWNVLNSMAPFLGTNYVNAQFDFYSKTLSGIEVIKPRWKRVIDAENSLIGEDLGQLYVKKYFPPEVKKQALKIVRRILISMKDHIESLTWMSAETKGKAIAKLSLFSVKIGYPDKWIDYSKLKINKDSYADNVIAANYFNFEREMNKIGKPTDRGEWEMTPQTVNAYYQPLNNEIVFPAAILQPPFFNPKADDAINYGAMGVVIGHEITHAFDDQGKEFDGHGNMQNWWSESDSKNFSVLANKMVDEYSKDEPIKGFNINGKLTLGENIADNGGVAISFDAFKKTNEYKEGKSIDGFTPAQRFFLGYAQVWRNNIRDAQLIKQIKTDPHSPAKYRVNTTLSNSKYFMEAFDIKPGDKMYKDQSARVNIW